MRRTGNKQMSRRWRGIAGIVLGILVLLELARSSFPLLELEVFCRVSAWTASAFTGLRLEAAEQGWLLLGGNQPVLVNSACSGIGFFMILTILLTYHFGRRLRGTAIPVCLGFLSAFILTAVVNGIRIVTLVHAHNWLIPSLPSKYAMIAHMLVGVAVFLPILILIHSVAEYYGNKHIRAVA